MVELKKIEIEWQLCSEDIHLFQEMDGHYTSENEKIFFETLFVKMQTECAPCRETLINEFENDDNLFFLRDGYDEFIIGKDGMESMMLHTMCLSEAMNANLMKLGFVDDDLNLFQWLRRRDYEGLSYNRNNAYM